MLFLPSHLEVFTKKNHHKAVKIGANVCDHINHLTGSHVQQLVHYDSHWCEV